MIHFGWIGRRTWTRETNVFGNVLTKFGNGRADPKVSSRNIGIEQSER